MYTFNWTMYIDMQATALDIHRYKLYHIRMDMTEFVQAIIGKWVDTLTNMVVYFISTSRYYGVPP